MTQRASLSILKPGPLTTVQDLGRPGFAGIGVTPGGACDAISLRLGNLLVGNEEGAAALEITLGGLVVRFERETTFALTGAYAAASLGERRIDGWRRYRAIAGDVLRINFAEYEARLYLCVTGGIAAPETLGSRSTSLTTGIGGFKGRALRKGDALMIGEGDAPTGDAAIRAPERGGVLRVLPGPEWARFDREIQQALLTRTWRMATASNRMGARLEGPSLVHDLPELASHAVQLGVIQLPPAGEPILLLADAQTTGGYPKPLVVIQADLWRAGQFRPGESVRFREVTRDEALAALRKQREWLESVGRRLRADFGG